MDNISTLSVTTLDDIKKYHDYLISNDTHIQNYNNEDYECGPFANSDEWHLVKETDWQYKINKYGFRDTLIPTNNTWIFGCSCTFGVGVDVPYPKMLGANNMGMIGTSIDTIARLFSSVQSLLSLKNKNLIFFLPDHSRFCWPDKDTQPTMILNDTKDPRLPMYVSNYHSDLEEFRTINYLNWIYDNAKNNNLKVCSWSETTQNLCRQTLPKECIIDLDLKSLELDYARDKRHPGTQTHRKLYETFKEVL